MKKFFTYLCTTLFASSFLFFSCSFGGGSGNSSDWSVGSRVTYNGDDYYVVANSTEKGSSRAAISDPSSSEDTTIIDLIKEKSVVKATEYAESHFGENIFLIRVSGQITVGETILSRYENVYNNMGKKYGADISKYFNISTTDSNVNYADVYMVLNSNKERIGEAKIMWHPSQNKDFESGRDLFELLEVSDDEAIKEIRSTEPSHYKLRGYDSNLKKTFDIKEYTTWNSDGYQEYFTPKKTLYRTTDNKIAPAACEMKGCLSGDTYYHSFLSLNGTYGKSTNTTGLRFYVVKGNDEYVYYITNAYRSRVTEYYNITFDENNIYKTTLDFKIEDEDSFYKPTSTMRFPDEMLSIPVHLILNEDGSVSFGQDMYDWATKWRDYIVRKYSGEAFSDPLGYLN